MSAQFIKLNNVLINALYIESIYETEMPITDGSDQMKPIVIVKCRSGSEWKVFDKHQREKLMNLNT
jgi:hypothetical protein